MHFTLKTNALKRSDLDEFVACYAGKHRGGGAAPAAGSRASRRATWSENKPDGRWRAYGYDELVARDKASLDLFWLRDEALSDSDNLPAPAVIAAEIVQDLEAALEQFREIAVDLGEPGESAS
jgi:type I restriction enzyme M protein